MKIKKLSHLDRPSMIDMAPLINVVFLLLIFFMLTSTLVVQPSINVNLPVSVISDASKEEGFTLLIQKNGMMFLNEQAISAKELPGVLQVFLRKNPNQVLIIKADQESQHGWVVEAIGLAKKAGVTKLAIATKPGFEDDSAHAQ